MNIFEFVPPIEIHQDLNPKIWEKNKMRPDVSKALLNIAKEYYDFLELPVEVKDIVVSGSQANFNYSPYSDIDLHFIVSYDDVQCDMEVDELFDTKRKLWKEQHDITIHGIPVELYVEDEKKPAVSSTYSILKQVWLKYPTLDNIVYNKDAVKEEVKKWTVVINHAISSNNLDVCRKAKDMLYQYRQAGLAKAGEFSVPNLTFKSLRNAELISKLMEKISDLYDKEMSI
jgi:predicted nucleotidyltransferase